MERAERATDLEKAARLRYGEMRQVEEQIRSAESKLQSMQNEGALLKEEVNAEEIATIGAHLYANGSIWSTASKSSWKAPTSSWAAWRRM